MKSCELADAQIMGLPTEMARQYAESSDKIALLTLQTQHATSVAGAMSLTGRAECECFKLQYTVLSRAAVIEVEVPFIRGNLHFNY